MKKLYIYTALLLSIISCRYPVENSKLPAPKQFLIIDAEVTQAFARVDVNYTLTEVTSKGGYLFPKRPDATARIVDDLGNEWLINTEGKKDTSFHGSPGVTYQLIVDAEGQHYESAKETMRDCPAIDSLYPLYTKESARDPEDFLYDGFDVYAEFKDAPVENNYYQWDWIHYHRTFACDRITVNNQLYKLPCTPYDCWGIDYNTRVIVQSDLLRDGSTIAKKIVRIPYSTPPLKYYLNVQQRAITPSVYDYLKSLETQTQNTGSIFDVPAQTKFNPNVVNTDNPSEQILGVFNVYSFKKKIIFIDMRQDIPGAVRKTIIDSTPWFPDPLAQAPCTETTYRTQNKPEGWED